MKNDNILFVRIGQVCEECARHISRINRALGYIEHCFPLTEAIYESLSEEDIDWFDQLIYRYTKLQDKIGESLIKNISIMLEGESQSYKRTFIDHLNILEAHSIIENASVWERLRSLRNELTHEYASEPNKQVAMLNELKCSVATLIDVFSKMHAVFERYS